MAASSTSTEANLSSESSIEVPLTPREVELEARVKQDPTDAEAWEEMASLVSGKRNPIRMRSVMERMLEKFPFSGDQWVRYAEMEEENGQTEAVKNILRRVLNTSYSVEIWVFYLSWLRRTKLTEEASSLQDHQSARAELREAFEEAIKPEKVGCAMDANIIWRMYIDFLEEEPEMTPYEQGQKMDALRKLYRQACTIPIRGLEALWKEYQQYEMNKHERTAKQLLDEITPAYNHAAEVLKERETYWRPILPSSGNKSSKALPRKPNASNNMNHADAWLRMLQYEKGNPEQVSPVQFKVRVRLAYRKALVSLWFHSDVWYSFFDFEKSVKDDEASLIILRESLHALPDSALLHFCLADALETDGAVDDARSLLDSLLERHPTNAAFIQRMRFARRVDGIAASREVFRRARQWEGCGAAVYCAAAEIEFMVNKSTDVARRVFDLGLKRFPKNPLLAHHYLDLMRAVNDDDATRDVFERLIESFQSNRASSEEIFPVWERYRDFAKESCRDLQLVEDVERRMQSGFRSNLNLVGLLGVLHRYVTYDAVPPLDYLDVDPEIIVRSSETLGVSALTRLVQSTRKGLQLQQHQQQQQQQLESNEQAAAAATAAAAAAAEDASIPPFLKKLVSILPRKLHGIAPPVDFVMRNLIKGTLPPAPVGSSSSQRATGDAGGEGGDVAGAGGGDAASGPALVTRKRRSDQVLGADGAPVDAFKQRQKRNRG